MRPENVRVERTHEQSIKFAIAVDYEIFGVRTSTFLGKSIAKDVAQMPASD